LDGGVGVGIEVEVVGGAGRNEEFPFWVEEGDVSFKLGNVPRGVVSRVKDVKAEFCSVNVDKAEAC
jgi:hypothetical protein